MEKVAKFKVGARVRITKKDESFGWVEDMEEYIGTEQEIEGLSGAFYCSTTGYVIDGWVWSEDALELLEDEPKNLTPVPGDEFICNNGYRYTCCTLDFLKEKGLAMCRPEIGIFGYRKDKYNIYGIGWISLTGDAEEEWQIKEVIPQESILKGVKEMKEEVKYTEEDIRIACNTIDFYPGSCELLLKELSNQRNPEYKEYLRLKAIYESKD